MYVDDVLDSCETVEGAQHLRRQLSDLLGIAGFKLRKWSSNEPVVIKDISEEDRLPILAINKDDLPKTKTLGVMWEAQRDVFTFKVEQPLLNRKTPTKRNVLSAIASLFDPLQFLAPFTVRAKILMQEIWMPGIDWDDVLPEKLKSKWEKWVAELPQLSNVAVPRCLRQANPDNIELHLFSDASNDAFASVAYLVCRYLDSKPLSRDNTMKIEGCERRTVTRTHMTKNSGLHLYSGLLGRKLHPGSPIFLLSLPRGIKAVYSLCSSVSIVPANRSITLPINCIVSYPNEYRKNTHV